MEYGSKIFDYVILGGGAAGCVMANRLSASGRYEVLLVEAGKDFSSLSPEEWQGYDPSFAGDVSEYITSRASVESRKTPQSTNPIEVARALAAMELWVQTQQSRRTDRLK